jgi:hypothetical protein
MFAARQELAGSNSNILTSRCLRSDWITHVVDDRWDDHLRPRMQKTLIVSEELPKTDFVLKPRRPTHYNNKPTILAPIYAHFMC